MSKINLTGIEGPREKTPGISTFAFHPVASSQHLEARATPRVNGARLNIHQTPSLVEPGLSDKQFKFNREFVSKLAESTIFREFRAAFEKATSLHLTLRPVESWQLAQAGNIHQNRFCALLAGQSRSCAACLQMQQDVCNDTHGESRTKNCVFGLVETAVEVRVGQELVAYLQTGQVFFKAPTKQQTSRARKQMEDWGLDIDLDDATRSYQETPVVDKGEYLARVRLLQFFADQLGASANQIVLQQQTAEPLQIMRARRFIEEHYQEDLRLSQVGRSAGMSRFHFCKRFKQTTGMTFTAYVSRVRVEKAKRLLMNLNYRVSEIAAQVGFQSVTHFNRIFKAVAGVSPSEFRRHAPGI
jgi:AraC-like DNA-binding protein/ligand-binding sensor protein